MKTKKWLYIVVPLDGPTWYGVFDYEISKSQVEKEFREETGLRVYTIEYCVLSHFQSKCDPLAVLPEVSSGVLFALEQDLLREEWFKDQLLLLSLNQPIISEYLKTIREKHSELHALIGVIVYKLIESQIEVNLLE